MSPKVSIIIPCQGINFNTRESIEHCLSLEYSAFEVLVLPDSAPDTDPPGITVIPTGKIGPGEKRDMAVGQAEGEFLAFIDDDAYPARSWLKEAVEHFHDSQVAAVVGPAVTPASDSLRQRASGFTYSAFIGSGGNRYRYIPQRQREVDDYPSCNFIVRKSVFKELGGFSTVFWPGEDTKFCFELTKKLHKRIIYDPKVLVYHHRRKLFIPHLKQVWSYAVHRGCFVKKFPGTSLRVLYFLPSLLFLGLIVGIPTSIFSSVVRVIFLSLITLYVLLALTSSLQARELRAMPLVVLGIISTHLTYGLGFLKGLCSKELVK